MKALFYSLLPIFLLLISMAPHGAGCSSKETLRILAADGLAHPFRRLQRDFAKEHPQYRISLETQGSILLSRLAILRPCDVLAVADYRLVQRLLSERHAPWVLGFATTELGIAWTESSKYKDEMKKDNWWKVLLREDVNLLLANPDQDPCGYFTLFSWKLAEIELGENGLYEKLRKKCPKKRWALNAADLLTRLQANEGDYGFVYRCHAQDMHLPFLPLPAEYNLGERKRREDYARVSSEVPNFRGGKETMKGAPVIFGITRPRDGKHRELARSFIEYCFSERGKEVLAASSLHCLEPPLLESWTETPAWIEKLTTPEQKGRDED